MHTGEIKFYKSDKGFGFITMGEGDDVFFHIKAVVSGNEKQLIKGAKVSFEIVTGKDGREKAVNVNIL